MVPTQVRESTAVLKKVHIISAGQGLRVGRARDIYDVRLDPPYAAGQHA